MARKKPKKSRPRLTKRMASRSDRALMAAISFPLMFVSAFGVKTLFEEPLDPEARLSLPVRLAIGEISWLFLAGAALMSLWSVLRPSVAERFFGHLAVKIVLAIAVLGVGAWLWWYTVSNQPV